MKLVRYGAPGKEKPGLVDLEGKLRDLSGVVADIAGTTLTPRPADTISAIVLSCAPRITTFGRTLRRWQTCDRTSWRAPAATFPCMPGPSPP